MSVVGDNSLLEEPHAEPSVQETKQPVPAEADAPKSTPDEVQPEKAAEVEAKDDVEQFSGLPIVNRTVPADKWANEVRRPNRRYVSFSHIPLYFGSDRTKLRVKENIIIGVLYYNSAKDTQRLATGEQYLRWRLTDLSQQSRQIVLQLRWGAYLHWRQGKPATMARRGSIFAILNPVLVEIVESHPGGPKEAVMRVEKGLQVEKLGDCPALGSCKKQGCRNPCDLRERQSHCRMHKNIAYAEKSVPRINGGGGVDARTTALLKNQQKKSSQKVARALKAARLEYNPGAEAKELEDKAQNEKLTKMELTKSICERLLDNDSDAKENYVRCIRNDTKLEDCSSSRVPKLGRGLSSSSTLEVTVAANKRRIEECDELEVF